MPASTTNPPPAKAGYVFTHTPTPWCIHRYPQIGGGNGFQLRGDTGGMITIGSLSPGHTTDRVEPIAEANAALIVRAVNAHDALISELCKAQKIIANALNIMTPEQKQQWADRNAATNCDGEGTTRAHERLAVIERARGDA